MDTRTGDHFLQFLRKSDVTDFVVCQTCWYGAEEVDSMFGQNATVEYIASGAINLCSKYMR